MGIREFNLIDEIILEICHVSIIANNTAEVKNINVTF